MSTKRASKTSRGSTAVKLDKALWEKAKRHGMRAANKRRIEEGLEPVWSARAAQLAVQYYKAHGGRYEGKKTGKEGLSRWTKEQWQTRPGTAPVAFRKDTTARYLPKAAWARLSAAEQRATDQKKRRACKGDEGSCFVPNTRRAERAGARVRSRSRAGSSTGKVRPGEIIENPAGLIYWHATSRKNFKPSSSARPWRMRYGGLERSDKPSLYATSSLHYWANIAGGSMGKPWAKGRKWAAELLILEGHPPIVSEHFERPEVILDPNYVCVLRVIPLEHAIAEQTGWLNGKFVGNYRYQEP